MRQENHKKIREKKKTRTRKVPKVEWILTKLASTEKIHKRPYREGTIRVETPPYKTKEERLASPTSSNSESYVSASRERGIRGQYNSRRLIDPNIGKPPSLCIKPTTRKRQGKILTKGQAGNIERDFQYQEHKRFYT